MMQSSETIRGAVLMMAAMAGFTFNDAFMRGVLEDLPLFQSIFLRGVFVTICLVLIAYHQGDLRHRTSRADKNRIYLRSACELFGTFAFLTALTLMPFANIAAIMQVLPLSVTLAAALFLGTPIGWRRLSAILIGFAGVLIVIRPGTDGFTSASFLVLFVVVVVTVRDLAARSLTADLPSTVVALNASLMLTVLNGILMLLDGWTAVTGAHLLAILAAAAVLTIGYIAAVGAMRVGDIATIAPFRYTSLLWAILIGYLAFEETPDSWTLIGSAIIVAMGLFSFYREHRLLKNPVREESF